MRNTNGRWGLFAALALSLPAVGVWADERHVVELDLTHRQKMVMAYVASLESMEMNIHDRRNKVSFDDLKKQLDTKEMDMLQVKLSFLQEKDPDKKADLKKRYESLFSEYQDLVEKLEVFYKAFNDLNASSGK